MGRPPPERFLCFEVRAFFDHTEIGKTLRKVIAPKGVIAKQPKVTASIFLATLVDFDGGCVYDQTRDRRANLARVSDAKLPVLMIFKIAGPPSESADKARIDDLQSGS